MRAIFDLKNKEISIKRIEGEMQASGFWDDMENAKNKSEELARIKEEIESIKKIRAEIGSLEEFSAYLESDEEMAKEFEEKIAEINRVVSKEETKIFFGGPHDKGNAIITIYAGAGGVDAQDWAGMLLRMYERYSKNNGFKPSLISTSLGEDKGVKEAVLEISGKYAYGYLKRENGVHRLVRISPYSAQKLRHTSFALVEVLPQIQRDFEKELDIRPEDLIVQTFRASGPGGQYVNKTESAVRIKHLPTGIIVESQSGRLQGENKESAMKLLRSRIFALKIKEKKEEMEKLKGGIISAEWGSQIRSYVLHPYKMVKDHRTGVETSDTESVLGGDLNEFIQAEVGIF